MDTVISSRKREPLVFDHFEVERVLGRGAMGIVYLARDLRIGRRVALKTIHRRHERGQSDDESHFLKRFRREAELCASFVHPNIVTLFDAGYESGRFTYLAMEYVEGESLHSLLGREKKLGVDAASKIVEDVLKGLGYAHERGIVHRDVKPANILLSVEGDAKVTDFGIARSRARSGEVTEAGQLLGTPHYMAPEQIRATEVDQRADLFSVGVLLYEMLAGEKPFHSPRVTDVLFAVVNEKPKPLREVAPEVPEGIAAVVERLMRKAPEERFQNAAEALHALRLAGRLGAADTEPGAVSVIVSPNQQPPEDTPTTPISSLAGQRALTRTRPWYRREIPPLAGYFVIAVVLLLAAAGGFEAMREISTFPDPLLTAEQLREFNTKAAMLKEAQLLHEVGAYSESRERFESYLALYPWSSAALEGRDHARAAEEELERARREAELSEAAPAAPQRRPARRPATVETPPEPDPEPPPSLWKRMRGLFRRG
jgi:serine/threonine protein kinase